MSAGFVFSVLCCLTQVKGQGFPSILLEKPISHYDTDVYEHSCRAVLEAPSSSQIVRKPYDVLRYDLFMDWRNPLNTIEQTEINRSYTGLNTIQLKMDSANVSKLTFDAVQLRIDSIVVNTKKISYTQNEQTFTVDLEQSPQIGDTLTLYVHYTYVGTQDRGFHAYAKGTPSKIKDKDNQPLTNPEGIVYTMSQPENARYWMPCNDAPYDKARTSITVRVPRRSLEVIPFSVSSNGLLESVKEGKDEKDNTQYADYKWSDTTLIPTYLMVANASRFTMFRHWYKRVSNPNDSIPIDNYVWAIDMKADTVDNAHMNALRTFGDAPSMLGIYSRLFGEYPFSKYGHTVAAPFDFGGMEHQTMTTTNRSWARSWSAIGIAHEIVHQWIGDLVTCATWKDIWLNEGGATWGEALWYESWAGNSLYINHLNVRRRQYLEKQPQPPIWGIPINIIFNYATTYCKAGWVYHMMRKTAGDDKFYPALRSWLKNKSFGYAETEELHNHFQAEIPLDGMTWRQFFDQWLYSAGHPIYQANSTSNDNGNGTFTTTINLKQIQSGENVPEVFTMPVTLELRAVRNAYLPPIRTTFMNNQRSQEFTIETPFAVADVIVDPDSSILAERENYITSAEDITLINDVSVTPNPAQNNLSITLKSKTTKKVSITIIDIEGKEVLSVLNNHVLYDGVYSFPISLTSVTNGCYRVLLRTNSETHSYPFVVFH